MLCVLILYISGGFYSYKSTPKDRFFEKLHGNFIYSQGFSQKSAESKSQILFHIFISFMMSDLGFEPRIYVK